MKYITELFNKFELLANQTNAQAQKAYMKNKFEFFGMYTKERDAISKQHIKDFGFLNDSELIQTTQQLFNQSQRDFHYVAIDLVAFHKSKWKENIIELIEYLIITNSWWDSVDNISTELVAPYFKKFPKQKLNITNRWNKSNDMWLQRVSIIFQNKFKTETDKVLLAKYILNCKGSKEFFIQKAIGWALREYGKYNPDWVIEFVETNNLAPLSTREAIRNIVKNTKHI